MEFRGVLLMYSVHTIKYVEYKEEDCIYLILDWLSNISPNRYVLKEV